MPYTAEARLGDIVDKQVRVIFGGKTCENPAGKAAFDKLMSQLRAASGIENAASASVISNDMANAVAAARDRRGRPQALASAQAAAPPGWRFRRWICRNLKR